MRIFKLRGNWLRCLVGEMINLESGALYYQNGELVPVPEGTKQRPPYPVYRTRNRTVQIRAAEGLIFIPMMSELPAKSRLWSTDTWTAEQHGAIQNLLTTMYVEAGWADSQEVLQKRRPLQTPSRAFTSLTAIPTAPAEISTQMRSEDKMHYRSVEMLGGYRADNALFTWTVVSGLDNWIRMIGVAGVNQYHPSIQLSSVMMDLGDWMPELEHGLVLDRGLSLRDLIWGKDIQELGTWGRTRDVLRGVRAHEHPSSQPGYDRHLLEEWDSLHTHPGWLAGYQKNVHSVWLCPVRGAVFEIARHLGRPGMFSDSWIPVDNMLGAVIYTVDMSQVIWSSGLRTEPATPRMCDVALDPQDRCARCWTPLYGDYYLLFAQVSEPVATPYCSVCMHMKYSPEGDPDPAAGVPLWRGKVLGRARHTRTLEDVIRWLPNQDPDYVAILTKANSGFEIVRYSESTKNEIRLAELGDTWVGLLDTTVEEYLVWCQAHGLPHRRIFPCTCIELRKPEK